MPTTFIVIGNPGNGKSTLLNILSQKATPHFKGGGTQGSGMTTKTDACVEGDITYTDTPGLHDIDETNRTNACAEISKALRSGGDYKVIFIVGERNGRVFTEDVATMNMVTDAAPEITMNKFSVIVNQTTKLVMNFSQTQLATFTSYVFCKRPTVSTGHVLFLPMIPELLDISSDKMDLAKVREVKEIKDLMKFADNTPTITLTPTNITEIDPRQSADYQVEALQAKLALDANVVLLEDMKKQLAANNKKGGFLGMVAGAGAGFLIGGPAGAVAGGVAGLVAES